MRITGYPPISNPSAQARIDELHSARGAATPQEDIARIEWLASDNRARHEGRAFNLNPATNLMNPRAEALLASGLGTRPSLGHPGDKYETGLAAIEEIEVIATALAAEVFGARFAEIRVPSGAIANLYAFMATTKPGDAIIVPPATIGGHVTHHLAGCAGLYGLEIHEAKVAADGYSVDLAALKAQAAQVKPKLITIGGSLNLDPHPVAEIAAIAHGIGAKLLFDAAHQCGMIAGKAWGNPLDDGADIMTMSTYKSLGGPPSGLIVSNDEALAARIDAIAFPGMTANFDAAKSAALAVTLADWKAYGEAYSAQMIALSQALAASLQSAGIALFETQNGVTQSHQFAAFAAPLGGGQEAAKRMARAGFLACGIGLPIAPVAGDLNGLRIGTPELARIGMTVGDMDRLGALIAAALTRNDPENLADEVASWRADFDSVHFIHS